MSLLQPKTLEQLPATVLRPLYNLSSTKPGIVHLGPGAFHRAHQAVYTDLAMNEYGGDWRIIGVSMRSDTLQRALAPQENLYTLQVLDTHPYCQVIGAFSELYTLQNDRALVQDAMTAETTYVISLTITEKGYCLDNDGNLDWEHPDITHDKKALEKPISAIGLICQTLSLRKELGHGKLTIISCDNLTDNGQKLGQAIRAFAKVCYPELNQWIEQNVSFPNSMVDSITPATTDETKTEVYSYTCLQDEWPIQREGFTQWVLEENFAGPVPAWDKVGVTYTANVAVYEKAKLRILNGTHSTIAYLGILFGFETVFEAISDPSMQTIIAAQLNEEIIPSLAEVCSDEINLQEYADSIVRRYHNEHIKHYLSQIAWDGSQKIPFRILGSIRDNLKQGAPIKYLSLCVAAWIVFLQKRFDTNVELVDPMAPALLNCVANNKENIYALGLEVLKLREVFGDLSDNSEFTSVVLECIKRLQSVNNRQLQALVRVL